MSEFHGSEAVVHHDEHPKVPYFLIAGTLLVFTIITIAASFVELGKTWNVILAFAIAAFKASLVMTFFMHLKYEKKAIIMIALAPFMLVSVLILALFPDVVNGQFHDDSPSKDAPATVEKVEHK